MTLSLPFKVWTGALLAHAIATGAALFFAQPAQALSFLVHFKEEIATQCAAHTTWEDAQSCVGAATTACYKVGKGWTDGNGRNIHLLVLSNCAYRELSFWDDQLNTIHAQRLSQGRAPTISLENWRETRNPTCWQSSKPSVAQFFGLNRPQNHIADCSIPKTAKLFFELKAENR